jgi:hypothetical protein
MAMEPDSVAGIRRLEKIWLDRIAEGASAAGNGVLSFRGNPLLYLSTRAMTAPAQALAGMLRDTLFYAEYSLKRGAAFLSSSRSMMSRACEFVDVSSFVSVEPLIQTMVIIYLTSRTLAGYAGRWRDRLALCLLIGVVILTARLEAAQVRSIEKQTECSSVTLVKDVVINETTKDFKNICTVNYFTNLIVIYGDWSSYKSCLSIWLEHSDATLSYYNAILLSEGRSHWTNSDSECRVNSPSWAFPRITYVDTYSDRLCWSQKLRFVSLVPEWWADAQGSKPSTLVSVSGFDTSVQSLIALRNTGIYKPLVLCITRFYSSPVLFGARFNGTSILPDCLLHRLSYSGGSVYKLRGLLTGLLSALLHQTKLDHGSQGVESSKKGGSGPNDDQQLIRKRHFLPALHCNMVIS